MKGFLKHRPQQYTYSANQFSSNKHTAAACLMVDALDHRALYNQEAHNRRHPRRGWYLHDFFK